MESCNMGRRTFVLSTGAAIAGSLSTLGAGAVASEGTAKIPPFRGMMPIMATPVDGEYKVDVASQRRHVEYCIQCGAVAIGHFAYASEFQKISDADRSQLLDVVVEQVAGRIPFFAGVTGRTAVDTVRYAREAKTRGADLIMVSLPFEEQLDQESTFTMFREIGSTVSLPIIIQDTPATADVLTPELVMRIAKETGQVHSIKAESADFLTKTADLMQHFEGTMQVIGGAGGQHMIHLLRLGVTAFMTGTEALEFHAAAVAAYLKGDADEAATIYFTKILPYFMFYNSGNWQRNLKMMLHLRGIIDTPNMCQPEDDIPPAYGDVVMKEFRWALDHIGWTKTWPNIP